MAVSLKAKEESIVHLPSYTLGYTAKKLLTVAILAM